MYLYYLMMIMFLLLSMMMMFLSLNFLYLDNSMFIEWKLLWLNSVEMNMLIFIDYMMLMFLSIVLIISSMIMCYSSEYMNYEKNKMLFLYLMLLFIMSMIFMVMSPNLISIMLGWDGLGLVSYLLVIFYHNKDSYNSGMLTFLLNRIGDLTMMVSMSLIFMIGSFNFVFYNLENLILMMFMILVTSITKSAQIPFSSWLPAAMAAPTPVSSLVHSSTLVTAGIYLLIRFNFSMNINMMYLLMMISFMTLLFSGMSSLFEYDLKKIIALSTLSQLGLMIFSYSMNMMMMSFFHLLTHAMFKSLLFMCAGLMIHNLMNQDIRNLGYLSKFMPLTMIMFNISSMTLSGMPFMSGFYSKDLIFNFLISLKINYFILMLMYFSIMLTMFYSMRLLYFCCMIKFNIKNFMQFYESKFMVYPMMMLMFLSIFGGSFFFLFIFNSLEFIYLSLILKFFLLYLFILSMLIIILILKFKEMMKVFVMKFFFNKMWFFLFFYNSLMFKYMMLSKMFFFQIEKKWIEMFLIMNMKELMNLLNFKMNLIFKDLMKLKVYLILVFLFMIN
uniref:NADH-ubiquinone oxidoreductase chain 5 n=1 Tax=Ismarus sp. ZJUH_2016020 TaxID=2491162 RepID=A0A3S5HLP7_9HYME|nr:NADH dehydrogenase subunit 5 [Ismarus sp. ZJUH_2016020]